MDFQHVLYERERGDVSTAGNVAQIEFHSLARGGHRRGLWITSQTGILIVKHFFTIIFYVYESKSIYIKYLLYMFLQYR